MRTGARVAGLLVCALALAAGLFAHFAASDDAAAATPSAGPAPNFLIVLADDQAQNSFKRAYMPHTFADVVDKGTRFRDGLAAPPLCCPDRAGILTGQYPHNHGVFSNDPGYPTLRDKEDTLPVWLSNAGYRTGFVGKFLNGYGRDPGAPPAPGFDRWFSFLGSPGYYDYQVSDNGRTRHFGSRRGDYSTNVFTRQATDFLSKSGQSSSPFFLWLAYEAPHGWRGPFHPCQRQSSPSPPTKAAYRAVKDVPLPRPPSFNERNVSDKPAAIRNLPRLDAHDIKRIKNDWHCTLGAVRELDRGVGRVMNKLRSEGEAQNTIVFYVSDNGNFFGEHRRLDGKSDVYEPSLNVPYAVKMPRVYRSGPRVDHSGAVVSNQDIAATIVDFANRYTGPVQTCASPGDCRRMDGRTLAPLVGGGGVWPVRRGVLDEINSGDHDYDAIRTPRFVYSELATGERELYDLHTDPYELHNRAGDPSYAGIQSRLAARLTLLRHCSGVQGRDAPSARPYCE
jgi:N-acetylglucosamine-6-sulfatase